MKALTLPDHPKMTGTRICPHCEGMMLPCTTTSTFTPSGAQEEYIISNIHGYQCTECGEIIYTSAEAKLVETAIHPYMLPANSTA